MNNNGTISLCMIVKDEEQNLGRCLESSHAYVDEIIVVDTGSQDATPDIARRYGVKVIHFPWQNDFSQARNESLKHASKEWVIILDADEELPLETAQNLRKLALTPDVDAWTFTIISPVSSNEDSQRLRHLNLRMFKNQKEYCFEGKIHEQVKSSILKANDSAVISHSNLEILHYGYIHDLKERRGKTLRNITILKEVLALNPGNSFDNFNLAVSYYTLGDLEKSQKHYEIALQSLDIDSVFAPALYRNYCLCLYEMGEYSQALELADKGLAYFPDYPDLYFLKGQVFWSLGMLLQVKASFLKCTTFKETRSEYISMEGVTTYLAFENLAEVYEREGHFKEAIYYTELVIMKKSSYRLLLQLCSLLKKTDMNGQDLAAYLESNYTLDFYTIAQLLFDIREFEACLNHLNQKGIDIPGVLLLKVKCLMYLGRYAEATESLPGADPDSPLAGEILKQQCIGLWVQNPRQDASELISAFDNPNSPFVISCNLINSLIFPDKIGEVNSIERGEISDHALSVALEVLDLGDKDLALKIGLAVSSSKRMGEGYFTLGEYALNKGRNLEAKKLLERAINKRKTITETYYLLGMACTRLKLHDRAFHYFLNASKKAPENELYVACALEQLASQCLIFVTKGLNLENRNAELRRELFRLASLKRKAQRFKEASSNG